MLGTVAVHPITKYSALRQHLLLSRPFMRKVRGRSSSGRKYIDWDGAGIFLEQERYLSGSGILWLKKSYRNGGFISQYLTGLEIRWKGRAARLIFIQARID